MKIISLLLLLPVIAFAKISVKEGMVQPFSVKKYSIVEFVKDYAFVTGKPVLSEELKDSQGGITFDLNTPISIADFEKMFYTIIESKGYSALIDGSFVRIIYSRDIRYMPSDFYKSEEVPNIDRFVMVIHKLKNPVASSITRNMRPFLSRYGRIIDFGDEHSIAINDTGSNINRLLKIISNLDNKDSLERIMKSGSKRKKDTTKTKVEKLELEKLELERELLKIKVKEGRGA
jgi:type II secretory pathway component GspD/PulD (secretin)